MEGFMISCWIKLGKRFIEELIKSSSLSIYKGKLFVSNCIRYIVRFLLSLITLSPKHESINEKRFSLFTGKQIFAIFVPFLIREKITKLYGRFLFQLKITLLVPFGGSLESLPRSFQKHSIKFSLQKNGYQRSEKVTPIHI